MPSNKGWLSWVAIGVSILGYLLIGYEIQRPETAKLLSTYALIFISYIYLVSKKENFSIYHIIGLGILFRLLFLFSTPSLSDDFYRFIWDGRLWFNGINPFAELPTYYINNPNAAPLGINKELFQLLNSPTHYTVYPPIPQFINWVAAWLATDSIWLSSLVLRIAHTAAEIGTLFLFPKVLSSFKVDTKNIVWYALNPLIIIELVGNLHHEALMIFFLMLFLANFKQKKMAGASFAFAMAVASKLLPLMFLPLILLKLNFKQKIRFLLIFVVSTIVIFIPLLDASFFRGIENSLLLYYQHFEFNAGVYYAFREIGFWWKGYNMIAIIGQVFAIGTTLAILAISLLSYFKKWKLPDSLLWISTIFALLSLILHPWYISLVILFGSMTKYKFGFLWSLLIMGTYAGYYANGFNEVMIIVVIEFVAVIGMLLIEIKQQRIRLS